MKLKYLFSFISGILLFNSVFSQNFEITFKVDINEIDIDSDAAKDLNPSALAYFRNVNNNNRLISEFLRIIVISDMNSYSMSFNDVMLPDGINNKNLNVAKSSFFSFDRSYKTEETSLFFNMNFPEKVVEIKEDEILTWEILEQTKTIAGYVCYKAKPKFNKDYAKMNKSFNVEYVWFSPDLNFSASPSYFGQLPGAVLEYKTGLAKAIALKVEETLKSVEPIEINNKEVMSYKEFNSFIKTEADKYMSGNN